MTNHFVIGTCRNEAACEERERRWSEFLRLLDLRDPASRRPGKSYTSDRVLFFRMSSWEAVDGPALFERACASLCAQLASTGELTVFVDAVDLPELNPLRSASWSGLVARLVLAHPQVRWLFSHVTGDLCDEFVRMHGVARAFEAAPDPLFDPSGLRDFIRNTSRANKDTARDAAHLRLRPDSVVAVDEERAYSLLHAYTAYRFGHRGVAVHTGQVADRWLGPNSGLDPVLTFEDLYISFPDRQYAGIKLSRHADRAQQWPKLAHADCRQIVTSGHGVTGSLQTLNDFLDSAREAGARVPRELNKPHHGMFALWAHCGVAKSSTTAAASADISADSAAFGHSSPGALMLVAEHLLASARVILADVRSVEDAVRGAVFATDAFELLGYRTPTMAFEALRLKHCLEVHAECQFVGVQHHAHLKLRRSEIEYEVALIDKWFNTGIREETNANARLAINTDLARVFRDHGRFDEELECLREGLELHSTLRLSGRWKFLRRFTRGLLRYLLYCLRSPAHFLLVGFFWVLASSVATWGVAYSDCPLSTGFGCAVQDAMTTFFSFGPPHHPDSCSQVAATKEWPAALVSAATIVIGFFHLGIFVSYMYSVLMRR